jgi:hypothetical protein
VVLASGAAAQSAAVISGVATVKDGDGILFGDCPHFSNGRYAQAEQRAKAVRDLSLIYALPSYCE